MTTGKKKWEQIENTRFSQESKTAYKDLQTILKHHVYEKRDGGIINQLLSEEGEIIQDTDQINELLAQTIEQIQVDHKWEDF